MQRVCEGEKGEAEMKPGWRLKYVPPDATITSPFTATVWIHHEANIYEVVEQFAQFLTLCGFSDQVIANGFQGYSPKEPAP